MSGPEARKLSNQRFGRVTVSERCGHRGNEILWSCVCDCGEKLKVTTTALCLGRVKSCGCSRRKPDGAFQELFRRYKKAATKRSLSFSLSEDAFRVLVSSPCFYCSALPTQSMKTHFIPFYYNGVDRLDNHEGYSPNNSVPCCGRCNDMKGTLGFSDFLERVYRIYAVRLKGEGADEI